MIEWYVWTSIGLILIVMEMVFFGAVNTLFLALGCLVAGVIASSGFGFYYQAFSALFGMFLSLYMFKRNKVGETVTCKVGQSDEFVGIKGVVQEAIKVSTNTGKVYLEEPINGESVWKAQAKEAIDVGTPIKVILVHSDYLVVEKTNS